jgi:hypothetical protein
MLAVGQKSRYRIHCGSPIQLQFQEGFFNVFRSATVYQKFKTMCAIQYINYVDKGRLTEGLSRK